ncbi:neprilysin-2 [Nasonia vitripennis]|uniref:Neprilysin n=1 Tax=Nasonia vitripennis TaxID=7425 RepID=A0A7M7ILZ9_NASVI|nr:neprilysin-2 [Nasonia vitripennis]
MANSEHESDHKEIRKSSGWRRFTTAEKLLLVVVVCGFVACVTLLIGLGILVSHHTSCNKTTSDNLKKREISVAPIAVKPDDALTQDNNTRNQNACHEFCSSLSCQNEASFFINNIDQNIDPCEDFYQFACGNFIKNAIIPDDENKIDMMSITQKKVLSELVDEIKKEIQPNEISAFKKLKIYYHNCMNKSRIQEEGTYTLLRILDELGDWPVLLGESWTDNNYNWPEIVFRIKDHGYPVLFPVTFYVGIDPKNTTKNILKILGATTRVSPTYLLDGPSGKIPNAYYDYMVDIAVMLGADKDFATKDMQKCLDFEVELFNIQSSLEILMNITATHNPITIIGLSEKYPSIPWLELISEVLNLSNVSVDENEVVIVNDLNFFSKIEKLIARTPKRVIANYLIWQVVYDSIDYLPDAFLDRKLMFSRVVRGVKERKHRSYSCIQDVMEGFSISLSALYVRRYFNKEIQENVLALVQNVKNQFRKMLEEVDWMDNDTKETALDKIDAMDVFVGYSDELFDDLKIDKYYEDLDINYGSYLKSAFNISLFFTKQYYASLRGPVNKKDWKDNKNAAIINAYYYLQKNTFEIPAGFLRGSFYRYDRPKYLNYGAIGSIIGHEITHGFDSEGRKSDKNGNQIDWWQASTKIKYLEKANCFVQQYNNYTVKETSLKINGERTQSENIADNGGFKAAYYAYNAWINHTAVFEPCLPGLNYTAQQMFWISAANNWCRKQNPEKIRDAIARDWHSPPVARINVPFSNIHEFAEDFMCPIGTNMNPEKKCIIW